MIEVWKPVPGYEDFYQVSDQGRIRRMNYRNQYGVFDRPPQIMKLVFGGKYLQTSLCLANKCRSRRVHNLVMLAFVGPQPPGHQVAHGDGDTGNCALDNLRYATPLDNNLDKINHGTRLTGERVPNSKLKAADIPIIKTMASNGNSHQHIANVFSVSRRAIGFVISGETWKNE